MTLRPLAPHFLGVLLLVGGGTACSGAGAPTPTLLSGVSERALFEVEVRPAPDPIPLNEPFELAVTVRVREVEGSELLSRTLRVEGWMPGHGHGMLRQAQVDELGDGRYRVRGMLFHMPGEWELRVMLIETRLEEDYRLVEDDQAVLEVVL